MRLNGNEIFFLEMLIAYARNAGLDSTDAPERVLAHNLLAIYAIDPGLYDLISTRTVTVVHPGDVDVTP